MIFWTYPAQQFFFCIKGLTPPYKISNYWYTKPMSEPDSYWFKTTSKNCVLFRTTNSFTKKKLLLPLFFVYFGRDETKCSPMEKQETTFTVLEYLHFLINWTKYYIFYFQMFFSKNRGNLLIREKTFISALVKVW